MARYGGLLDACALVPVMLADTLLRIAFPAASLAPFGISAVHPDAFLLDQLDLAPPVVLDVLREQADHTRNPRFTVADVVAACARRCAGIRGRGRAPTVASC